jgi:hypothetical protein
MTREEAIEIIRRYECNTEHYEACEMAIQALEQEQDMTIAYLMGKYEDKAPCDDAISREYLFKVLDDFCGHDRTATITLDTLADIVYELPSVTQKGDVKNV